MTTEQDPTPPTAEPTTDPAVSEAAGLRAAMGHRTEIGIALGIVMTRLGVDQDAAFGYLRRVSSVQNRKLHVIATEIAETRQLPRT